MRTRLMTAAVSTAALALGLTACGSSGGTTESGVSLVKSGTLSVCTQLPYKPFEFQQGSDVVGFDISLMDELAKQLGVKVAVVQTPFEGIQSGQALNTKQCDIAAAGMTITDARKKVIGFSDPYFDATQALLVKKGGAKTLDDLAGKTIGVQQGTTGEIYTKKNAPKNANIRVFEDLGLLTTAVKTGQVDAAVQDNGPLLDYAKTNTDTEVTAEFDTGEQYGFGVSKNGGDKLKDAADKMLSEVKDDGTYDSLYKKWFGQAAPQS
ncbi:basic amino acid ABC transporter substrate-binding protein [Marmoricola endophyticus]|nr:basic amino acid ABC transporter substrate-binding protein [Marmoricola endophyticus]